MVLPGSFASWIFIKHLASIRVLLRKLRLQNQGKAIGFEMGIGNPYLKHTRLIQTSFAISHASSQCLWLLPNRELHTKEVHLRKRDLPESKPYFLSGAGPCYLYRNC